MPADVFAAQQQFALGVHEQRGVDCAAVLAQGLELADTVTQAIKPLGRWQWCAGQHLEVWQCLFHCFHAAQAAATGTRQLPALLLEVPEGAVGDGHLGMVRSTRTAQLQVIDVRCVFNDAAAQAEADDEVFKVGGGDQHDRLADAVIGNRQRHFLGQRGAVRLGVVQVAVAIALAGGRRGCFHRWRWTDRRLVVHRHH
ncbi:hypothetical protein D3C84_781200 [compost metagenome]